MAYTEIIETAKASGELKTSSGQITWTRGFLTKGETARKLRRVFLINFVIFIVLTITAMFLLDNPLIAGGSDVNTNRAFYPSTLNFWLALSFSSFVYVVLGLTFVHRVAGALVQFRYAFSEMTEGRLPIRFSIRDSDYPQEEASLFSEALIGLQEMQGCEYDRRAELRGLVDELADADKEQRKLLLAKMNSLLAEDPAED